MFTNFSKNVHAQYEKMQKHELYKVDVLDIFSTYLNSFPEGTNPIFRERTEHDCNCCKNFIRRLGIVVAIIDNKIVTVWDNYKELEFPYNVVGSALHNLVSQAPITSIFRTKEKQYSVESNFDNVLDKKWNHFFGKIDNKHYSTTPEKLIGESNTKFNLFKRGLDEIKPEALSDIIDLIESKSIYRGEEHLSKVKAFAKAQKEYIASDRSQIYIWNNIGSTSAYFRNDVIGTLAVDLSDGVELTKAVKSFERNVAPQNYKRPTALVTPKMIENAVEKIRDLGLEDALYRRFAKISDVSVNNVLWVDNNVRGKMKDGLVDLLMTGAKKPNKKADSVEGKEITIEEFLSDVSPKAKSIKAFVNNSHMNNFVSLTGGDSDDRIFKWNNNFAWSYDGGVADSLRDKVASLGGRVDGVLRFSHQWNHIGRNASLMDLHVFMPGSKCENHGKAGDYYPEGRRVGWNLRNDHSSGGKQDVDYTAAAPEGYVPVENITFPSMNKLPEGKYVFKIHNWSLRQPTTSGFLAEIEFGGKVFTYDHPKPLSRHQWVTVAEATLKDGKFTIEHHIPHGELSKSKWGIDTETFIDVDSIILSPNYWDDNASGNKHWFFILKDCKNPEKTRGIYNEFLRSDLNEHRKVFELLGDKTKCPESDEQLSGIGFSSTQKNDLTVIVDTGSGNKTYTIKF